MSKRAQKRIAASGSITEKIIHGDWQSIHESAEQTRVIAETLKVLTPM
jgi:hypothetical protein